MAHVCEGVEWLCRWALPLLGCVGVTSILTDRGLLNADPSLPPTVPVPIVGLNIISSIKLSLVVFTLALFAFLTESEGVGEDMLGTTS